MLKNIQNQKTKHYKLLPNIYNILLYIFFFFCPIKKWRSEANKESDFGQTNQVTTEKENEINSKAQTWH